MRDSMLPVSGIQRHKAAIHRAGLSRPVRLAVKAGLFETGTTFFDYGCGHGGDVICLSKLGYESSGWDPYYFPNNPRNSADIVNLSYVLNVIESLQERQETLLRAWSLTRKVLIVAGQVLFADQGKVRIACGDGIVTQRNTFQKYFEQSELKYYIDQILHVDSIPAALGIYFVFRDEIHNQKFRASRFHTRTPIPRVRTGVNQFEDYRQLLKPFIDFISTRGRLPVKGELSSESQILSEFGTFRRAFSLVLQATEKYEWEAIAEKHKQDLLVYVALSRFSRRPRFTELPSEFQNDIKTFCGTYKNACQTADSLLFSLGKPETLASKCRLSKFGKLVNDSLYVHVSALEKLDPILRLYEGCASRTIGRMNEVTLIKFRLDRPKISYLYYPSFDTDAHPALQTSMQIDLRDLYVNYRDYSASENPPILHRKELLVTTDYPLYTRFAKLTRQEEKWGLLDEPLSIGTRKGWFERLEKCGLAIRGHRVVRLKTAKDR